jgi:hypothetical protein
MSTEEILSLARIDNVVEKTEYLLILNEFVMCSLVLLL